MPTVTTVTKRPVTIPADGSFVVTAGLAAPVQFRQTRADRVSLYVWSKRKVFKQIDDRLAPFDFDINDLPPGQYALEFRPFKDGSYLTAERVQVSLSVIPRPAESTVPKTGDLLVRLFNDEDRDGVFDADEFPTGERAVRISTITGAPLPDIKTDSVGEATVPLSPGIYKLWRDFPPGYELSNDPRGYVTAEVVAGKKQTVLLGTKRRAVDANPPVPTVPPVNGGVVRPTSFPVECKSDTTYDCTGMKIDATNLPVVFRAMGVKNVSILNVELSKCSPVTDVVKADGCSNLVVDNVDVTACEPGDVVEILNSNVVSVSRVRGRVVNRYLCYMENVSEATSCDNFLAVGSKIETGLRFMGALRRLRVLRNDITNWLNPAKCTAIRVQGYGEDITVSKNKVNGLMLLGPMGEDQGGQKETDPIKRRSMLDRALKGVQCTNNAIVGGLGLMAGLEITLSGGSIVGKAGPVYDTDKQQNPGAYPISKVGWSYPEKEHKLPGDPERPAPVGTMSGVRFDSESATPTSLTYGNSNGPLKIGAGNTWRDKPLAP